jgi:hypothetical protein
MESSEDTTQVVEKASEPYIGQWNRLVSTTNWEKGRIIHEWRSALMASAAPTTEYSDEAWSRLVGGVTGQHAGRLRRVYERYGAVYADYDGLFWSHFQATLDWADAEMWLEGAVQNSWSVSRMRQQRWETMGGVKEDEPRSGDIVAAELDEDFAAVVDIADGEDESGSAEGTQVAHARELSEQDFDDEPRSPAGPDFGDEEEPSSHDRAEFDGEVSRETASAPATVPHRLLADLPPLPDDLSQAFEAFQLGVFRHKSSLWADVSLETVLAYLDALKVMAQSEA